MSKSTEQPKMVWQIDFDNFSSIYTLNGYVQDRDPESFQVISIETIMVKEYDTGAPVKVERYRLWYKFKTQVY